MLRRHSLLLVCLAACHTLAAAATVTGRVWRDDNENGRMDATEAGWAGVAVTDGTGFAVTGADGHYRLETQLDPLLAPATKPGISVCWPAGSWPTSPWFRRAGEQGDGTNVDFGLKPQAQHVPFNFIHGTDPHAPRGGAGPFQKFRDDVAAVAPQQAFCVITGDCANLSDSATPTTAAEMFNAFAEDTKSLPLPWFAVTGNHDCAGVRANDKAGWKTDDPLYAYGWFTKVVGPLRWSFDYADCHLVGIDFNRIEHGKWVWGVPSSAVDWLVKDLARVPASQRVLLFVHFTDSADPRLAQIVKQRVAAVFAGHTHTETSAPWQGVPRYLSGSIAEIYEDKDRRTGFRLVTVTAGGIESFYKAEGDPHAITLTYPRTKDTLKPGQAIVGGFYDLPGEMRYLVVKLAGTATVVPFERDELACRFQYVPDLGDVPAGPQALEVVASDGGATVAVLRTTVTIVK